MTLIEYLSMKLRRKLRLKSTRTMIVKDSQESPLSPTEASLVGDYGMTFDPEEVQHYNEVNVDSFHRNKSKTFSYSYSHNLTPLHPCFLPVQPYPKNYFVSTNESNDVDIENMTIAEYNLYVAKQGLGMNPLN
ncbi:hypothetical protein Tco_0060199 [Tanacetum coccineum]